MLIGLVNNFFEMLRVLFWMALTIAIVFGPIIYIVEKKTSDADFCPRIVDLAYREKMHCPPITPIALKK